MSDLRSRVSTNIIGLVSTGWPISDLEVNTYAARILNGILSGCQDTDYNLLLMTKAWQRPEVADKWLNDQLVDGLVVIAPSIHTDSVSILAETGLPVVAIASDAQTTGVPAVDVDNDLGAKFATEHLISLGHKRIAHFGGTAGQTSTFIRRDAFYRTMLAHGLEVPDDYVAETAYFGDRAYLAATKILSAPNRPTAIFGGNDHIAMSVISAAKDLGIGVPSGLSVIGYDDGPQAARWDPPLTTVRQPLEEMGSYAANILLQLVSGYPVPTETRLLAPDLIVRASTAAPRE
jgi:LacI family transcriptional regulator